jgi:hypothetical protein
MEGGPVNGSLGAVEDALKAWEGGDALKLRQRGLGVFLGDW